MAKRYIGDAVVRIEYDDETQAYVGTITANNHAWKFRDLKPPRIGHGAVDSPDSYDSMAAAAVGFGSYYTTHNRGDDLPEWAPPAEIADAISEATQCDTDDQGCYLVRRTPAAKGRYVA